MEPEEKQIIEKYLDSIIYLIQPDYSFLNDYSWDISRSHYVRSETPEYQIKEIKIVFQRRL